MLGSPPNGPAVGSGWPLVLVPTSLAGVVKLAALAPATGTPTNATAPQQATLTALRLKRIPTSVEDLDPPAPCPTQRPNRAQLALPDEIRSASAGPASSAAPRRCGGDARGTGRSEVASAIRRARGADRERLRDAHAAARRLGPGARRRPVIPERSRL